MLIELSSHRRNTVRKLLAERMPLAKEFNILLETYKDRQSKIHEFTKRLNAARNQAFFINSEKTNQIPLVSPKPELFQFERFGCTVNIRVAVAFPCIKWHLDDLKVLHEAFQYSDGSIYVSVNQARLISRNLPCVEDLRKTAEEAIRLTTGTALYCHSQEAYDMFIKPFLAMEPPERDTTQAKDWLQEWQNGKDINK